jgi:hypothetical protein
MADDEEKALIKKLGAESNKAFDPRYKVENRKWFVGKIIDFLESLPTPDSDMERLVNVFIVAATKAVNDRIKSGLSSGSLPEKWKLYDQRKSRTQIIYGMVAMNPKFLDAANSGYFDFILERRFRSIQRMNFWVNPNDERNVFAYPDQDLDTPEKMKVNKDAKSFWNGVTAGSVPFILSDQGKSDPFSADENLFKKNKGADRNLFACDPVATILHMDALALREATDPDRNKLLKALVGQGPHYLKIDNPLGHFANFNDGQRLVGVTSAPVTAGTNVEMAMGKVGRILTFSKNQLTPAMLTTDAFIPVQNIFFMIVLGDDHEGFLIDGVNPVTKKLKISKLSHSYAAGAKVYVVRKDLPVYKALVFHFITDSRPDHALFEQATIKSADLQVGDHVYLINHPLYKIFYPSGAWGGEHSFISEIESRDSTASIFQTTLKLEGHGLFDTLLGVSNDMVSWINKVLGTLQALTRIHLDYLKSNGRKTTADVTFIPRRNEQGIDVNVFEYRRPYKYTFLFWDKEKTRFTRITKPMTKGFVIKERADDPDSAFWVFNNNGTDSIVDATHPPPEAFLEVVFVGAGPAEQFTLSKWATRYFNAQTNTLETLPLFARDNKTPTSLTFKDLAKSKPFFVTDDVGDAYVTRPRVDFDPAYQTFLKNNGAF